VSWDTDQRRRDHGIRVDIDKSPRQGSQPTPCITIDDASEPAYYLRREQRRHQDISKKHHRKPPLQAADQESNASPNDRPPYRQAALLEHNDVARVSGVLLPAVNHVEESGADDTAKQEPRRDANNLRRRETRPLCLTQSHRHGYSDGHSNGYAIPSDFQRTSTEEHRVDINNNAAQGLCENLRARKAASLRPGPSSWHQTLPYLSHP